MAIVLGPNQYGKAETRIVRVRRDGAHHELTDLNVSTALAGDLAAVHRDGDNGNVLPTDSQKNTVYAFAREYGIGAIEDFGLRLARHFTTEQAAIQRARVHIEQYPWQRLGDHSFERGGPEVRTATVTCDQERAWVVAGLSDLVLCNTTGSEFWGFVKDRYTTLPETRERILATAVDARWRYAADTADWDESYIQTRRLMVDAFTGTHSLSLQQTLYAMAEAVLRARPEVVEVRLVMPNKHHFLVDLSPFGLDNPDEVYFAADRPYGLIEGAASRDDAPDPGLAWW
jgi:urate oxidase